MGGLKAWARILGFSRVANLLTVVRHPGGCCGVVRRQPVLDVRRDRFFAMARAVTVRR